MGAAQTWSIDGNVANGQVGFASSITGPSDALALNLTSEGGLDLQGDIEAGPVTISSTGTGFPGIVALFAGVGGQGRLNGTDGNPVSISGTSIDFLGAASVGPLSIGSGGGIGTFVAETGILSVDGGVMFGSNTHFSPNVDAPGVTAGADYSQLSATGPVNLAGATLSVAGTTFPQGGGSLLCPTLNPRDVDTLLTTTGQLTGTFANAPDGAVIQLNCEGGSGTPATARINYTTHAVIATILTSGGSGSATTTTLSANPSQPVTNQAVHLTATVTATSGAPMGRVSFADHGITVVGCASQPLTFDGFSYRATCDTTFTAASSPEALTAAFDPSTSSLQGSTSSVDDLIVGPDATSTALAVSATSTMIGQAVTYTARVAPAHPGAAAASGSVEFLDDGGAIGSCSGQPVSVAASSTATCTVSYSTAGSHTITAAYLGDANFNASAPSVEQTVDVLPAPAAKPSNVSPPTASGAPVSGQLETASTGTWSGTAPISYAYQWQRCNPSCTDIPDATASSYTLRPLDVGAQIVIVVTATNTVGSSRATSNKLGPVAPSMSQMMAALSKVVSPHGKGAAIGALLRNNGYTFRFTAPAQGTLAIRWYLLSNDARATAANKAGSLTVASARVIFTTTGAGTAVVRLSAIGRRLLNHSNRLRLSATATFTPLTGGAASRASRFTLRRSA